MGMYTRELTTAGMLSYMHSDPSLNFAFENNLSPVQMPFEAGQFREMNERANFLERDFAQTKFTKAQVLTFGDSLRNYNILPIGGGFQFSMVELAEPGLFGKTSQAEMVAEQQAIVAVQMKKYIEKAYFAAVTDNANYEGPTYYNDAVTPWSTTATANMKGDVSVGKIILGGGPYRLTMSNTAAEYAFDNVLLNSSTVVSGADRNTSVNPDPTAEFLRRYFGVSELVIASGDLMTDSGDPTDDAKSEIWGDSVLLERIGNPSLMQPSFMKHLYFAPLGRGSGSGGWFTIEATDEEVGGVGVTKWLTWNYLQLLVQEKTMAYRIDAVY